MTCKPVYSDRKKTITMKSSLLSKNRGVYSMQIYPLSVLIPSYKAPNLKRNCFSRILSGYPL